MVVGHGTLWDGYVHVYIGGYAQSWVHACMRVYEVGFIWDIHSYAQGQQTTQVQGSQIQWTMVFPTH